MPAQNIDVEHQLKSLLKKYSHQEKIKHKSIKCLFTGPPRVGKTTLKKRLLKTIKNLHTSNAGSPSGGLEKPITVVLDETRKCVTAVIQSGFDWQPLCDLLDEGQIVLEFINQQPTTHNLRSPTLSPVRASPTATTDETEADTLDEAKQLMQEVLAKKGLRSIKDIEKTITLYIMDTGGQPEFHEIMPLILNGPALHLVFFNLAFSLDDPIPIRFCQQDGTDSLITYNSSYTGKQMIYQLLSSLYCLSKDSSPDSESTAFLIGTHLDLLKGQEGQEEKRIIDINDSLKRLLSNVEFHDQAFLTYPTQDENNSVFIPVDNYSGSEEEIKQLQTFMSKVINDRFDSVELPSSWLWFHLILRHRYESSPGVCKLADCKALAEKCSLDEVDVPKVLRYIHRRLGTILFYEEIEGLNELVICDPNVLFKSIYHMVAVSFAGQRAYHTSAAEVRKTGEIPINELRKHTDTQSSSSLLTNDHVLKLLKHFKILTELREGIFFMPCLLQPQHSLELSHELLQSLCVPPLLVRFDGNYIPIGVFSALVVKLSQSSWDPDPDVRYRNHISFLTDGLSSVELMIYPSYMEFHIPVANDTEEKPKEIHQFCVEVRQKVVNTLKDVLDLHEHTKKVGFQLGFYCPGNFQADQPHFAVCLPRWNHTDPTNLLCSNSPRCQSQCRLPCECTIWFEYWKVSFSL